MEFIKSKFTPKSKFILERERKNQSFRRDQTWYGVYLRTNQGMKRLSSIPATTLNRLLSRDFVERVYCKEHSVEQNVVCSV